MSDSRRIPDWLAPHKNEWRSMSTMGALFNTVGRPMSTFLQEIRPRLRCVTKPSRNNAAAPSRYYLVKQVWACSLAHGVTLVPAARDSDKTEVLERRIANLQAELSQAINRKPEVRLVRNPDTVLMLTTMLTATEARPLPGVYFLISNGVVTYVGQSQNVLNRMSGHAGKSFDAVKMIHIPDPNERSAQEDRWILAFQPRDNIRGIEARKVAA